MAELSKKNIQPLADWILIEPENPEKTGGGLYVPEAVRAQMQLRGARVIAVGPGRLTETGHLRALSVKVGDVVWLDSNPQLAILPFDKTCVLVKEMSIVCVIKPSAEFS